MTNAYKPKNRITRTRLRDTAGAAGPPGAEAIAAGPDAEPAPRLRTVLVTLRAARLEADNAIHLVVSDPVSPETRICAIIPGDLPADAGDRSFAERTRRARQAFIDAIGPPPFEGFMLLYGAARLTVVRDHSCVEPAEPTTPALHMLGSIVDFTALDGPGPSAPPVVGRTD